jgi:hypothetical protein
MTSEIERVFGHFYGADTSLHQCEVLAIARIPPKVLAGEARLYGCKWFDYRPLHPVLATYLMAAHFNRAIGRFMVAHLDSRRGHVCSFKGEDVMAVREVKSYWQLRQKIDELGLPYDFFFGVALAWYGARGWTRPPRPGHISGDAELLLEAANAWERQARAVIPWAAHARYTAAQFAGAPDQLAYQEHLLARIMQKAQPQFALHAALYLHDALRIEAAMQRLPWPAIDAAIAYASQR